MLRITLRSFWSHKRRLVSTVVAIVLGVAFMAGTFVLTDTLDQVFDDLFADANEQVDAQVQGEVLLTDPFGGGDRRRPITPEILEAVRDADGIEAVEPVVTVVGFGSLNRVLDPEGEPLGVTTGPPTILENWVPDLDVSPYRVADGRPPEADDEMALNVGAADDAGYSVGDEVTVVSQTGRRTYTLVGTFTFGSAESVAGSVTADFTLAEAQSLAGIDGFHFLYAVGDGAAEQAVVDAVEPVLPRGYEVLTGTEAAAQLSSDVQSGFQFFKTALTIFAGIALLVGVFVISNTFAILLAQRTRELALLRAVGAGRAQVLRSVIAEALLVGLLASAIGLGVGIALAKGVLSLLEASGGDLPTSSLAVRPSTVILAFAVGLLVTLVAALMPAIRATRVSPLAALRDVAIDRAGASRLRLLLGVVIMVLAGFFLSAAWTSDGDTDALPGVGLGALLAIVGSIVIGPLLVGPSIRAIGIGLRRVWGIRGRLATENAARSPKRTSATVSALVIGVALVSFITVFAASATSSVESEVGRGFVGDFVVQSEGGLAGFSGFPSDVSEKAAAVDGVEVVTAFGYTPAKVHYPDGEDAEQALFSVDPVTAAQVLDPRMEEGALTDLTDDGILVDRQIAEDHGIVIGDELPVTLVTAEEVTLVVRAISDDQQLLGTFAISRALYLEKVPEKVDIQAIGLTEDGADVDQVLADVEKAISDTPGLEVLDREGFIDSIAATITSFVTVIYGLLILSIIIALIGVANTLSLSINERTRELGLLRAVGMDRSQLRSSVRMEAVLISVLGALVGIGLGLGLTYAMVTALEGVGLTDFALPVVPLLVIVVLAALLGTMASILPARRAAKLGILDAIAAE